MDTESVETESVESTLVEPQLGEITVAQSEGLETESLPEYEPSPVAAPDTPHGPDPVPDNVPSRRWKIEIKPKTYSPAFWVYPSLIHSIQPAPDQSASIDVRFFAELYINADDLQSKVLRLSTLGNGFSPGTLRKNEWRERGVFQDKCSMAFGPTGDHPLTMGGNSPENHNAVADYSSTTSFEVSGKVGTSEKDGGKGELGGSFSVSNTVKTMLTDFQVVNQSGPEVVKWTWTLAQMGDGLPDWTYPYNGVASLVTLPWYNTCPVPALARGKLFPACQAYWFAPRDFGGCVTFSVTAIQSMSYVVTAVPIPLIYKPGFIGVVPSYPTALTAKFSISFDESLWQVAP